MNMMPNGMPNQGAHMNRMQQPQPGNMMQQLHASVLNQLKNDMARFTGSWQATHDIRDRAQRVVQLLTGLRMIEPDTHKCLQTATRFESDTIARAPNRDVYVSMMQKKLSDIQARRNQNANNLMVQQQQQQQQNGMNFGNGGQMNMAFTGQMPQQQLQQMPSMTPQNGTLNPAALNAPPMQQQPSQQGNTQMNTNGAPNMNQPMQAPQPTQQEIHAYVTRSMNNMSNEQKDNLRRHVYGQLSEQQRQQFSATGKDPLPPWLMNKARTDIARKRASQMGGMPGVQTQNGNAQQANGGFDFASIMGQQVHARQLQADGGEVVPASNNANVMFNGQMNTPNPQSGGINPAMLGVGNNMNGNNQPQNGMNPNVKQMMLVREQQRQEAMRNSNAVARSQALQQAALHGQPGGLTAPNALTGAAGGSPAMSMLNRPMQNPPGGQTPNTPQQPNRTPNMQQPNTNQPPGQTPGNGANALLQHLSLIHI